MSLHCVGKMSSTKDYKFLLGDLFTETDICVATVSERWLVKDKTVAYPPLVGRDLEIAMRTHEEPEEDWVQYTFKLRKICGKRKACLC